MDMFGFLWNADQEKKIAKVANSVSDRMERVEHYALEVNFLKESLERVAITNAALIELLNERIGVSEQDILGKIEEIDLRDGVKDGKITSRPRNCAKCSRVLPAKRRVCLYCGESAA